MASSIYGAGVRSELDRLKSGNVMRGKVFHIEDENYFVKDSTVTLGDRIGAEVKTQNHTLSITPMR